MITGAYRIKRLSRSIEEGQGTLAASNYLQGLKTPPAQPETHVLAAAAPERTPAAVFR